MRYKQRLNYAGQLAKKLIVSRHAALISISAIFPLFAFINNINPRNDSLNKFDNLVLFARYFRVENQFPIWTTNNFGALTALENLSLRPEEVLAIILSRALDPNSVQLIISLVIYLALLVMNYCFLSICEKLDISSNRLIFALILILNFVAFPFSQYWLHFLVIFDTVILVRIFLSIGSQSILKNISLLIPVSFIIWGGYSLILPGVALIPIVLMGLYRRSEPKVHSNPLRNITWLISHITPILSLIVFSILVALYLIENKVVAPGRSSSGISTLDSYLAPAGNGFLKYFELLGGPTIWQDTHLVITPLLIPFCLSFIIFRFSDLEIKAKKDFILLILTCFWSLLLTLPHEGVSSVLYNFFPPIRLTRNPGFQTGILIPLLLLIMGMIFSRRMGGRQKPYKVSRNEKIKSGFAEKLVKREINHSTKQNAKMHLCSWIIILILFLLDLFPYTFAWTRILLGHLNSPLTIMLICLMGFLVYPQIPLEQTRRTNRFPVFSIVGSLKTRQVLVFISTTITFSLGIFQMYFLSFVDHKNVEEMRPKKSLTFTDTNLVERLKISQFLEDTIVGWKDTDESLREKLITEERLSQLGYDTDEPWMRLIDQVPQYRTIPFQEFNGKSFFDSVLSEKTPLFITDPNNSTRAKLRTDLKLTTNLVSSSAYGLNEDFCPSLGLVLTVPKSLSTRTVNLLNQPNGDVRQTCSGKKFLFFDEVGNSADNWVENVLISLQNGKATIKFVVKDEFIGKSITIVYRDSFSKFWKVHINGVNQLLQSDSNGFKKVTYTIQKKSNRVTFDLVFALKLLVNIRMIIDPLMYFSIFYYLVFVLRKEYKN